jgi:hypothetical protein
VPLGFTGPKEALPEPVSFNSEVGALRRRDPRGPSRGGGAVTERRQAILQSVNDPKAWVPAKTFAVTAQAAGADLADIDAVNAFVDQYNQGLAA